MKAASDSWFQNPAMRRWLVKLRVPIGIVVIVLIAPFVKVQWLVAGFVVSMFGELIQLWCFASLDKNTTLTVRGPYTMVRNPMYLGRFFIPLGFLMLLGQGWLVLIYAVGYWLYMHARVQREEAHLRPIFGAPYEQYLAEVRRFIPGRPQPDRQIDYWNWTLFKQNNAGTNLLATLAVWALVAAWTLWGLRLIEP